MRSLVLLLCGLASTSWAEAPSAFSASAGVGFLNRSFTWNGDSALTQASQPFAGAVAVDASWFPGAHTQAESLDELNANLREVLGMLREDGEP